MAWILTNGPIPDGLWVLHRCDVKLCVRPDHLFLGDPSANVVDMYAKGRAPAQTQIEKFVRGTDNPAAKLNEAQVRVIRQRRANGETLIAIAVDYGIACSTVDSVAKRCTWRHIDPV